MKTIVVGYDETEPATRALERAAEFAAAFDARPVVISVAHVLMPVGHGIGPYDPVDPPALHREQLARASAVLEDRGIEADYELAVGDPAGAIVDLAEQREADMIIVGTREPSFIARLFGLSVSEEVQRRAHCDVLIVH